MNKKEKKIVNADERGKEIKGEHLKAFNFIIRYHFGKFAFEDFCVLSVVLKEKNINDLIEKDNHLT